MRSLTIPVSALVLLLVGTASLFSQDSPVFSLGWSSGQTMDTSLLISVHSNMPRYMLKVVSDDSGACLIVLSKHARTADTINMIPLYESYQHGWPPPGFFSQTILFGEDFNFDGYLDLAVITDLTERRDNPIYSIWLFDPKSRSFRENDDFTEHMTFDYTIDKKAKTISVNYLDEPQIEDCHTSIYKVAGDKMYPIRVESVETIWTSDTVASYLCQVQKVVKGRLILVKRAIVRTAKEIPQFFKR